MAQGRCRGFSGACGENRQLKYVDTEDGIYVCYGCYPAFQRIEQARRQAEDDRRFAARRAHPAKGTKTPLRRVTGEGHEDVAAGGGPETDKGRTRAIVTPLHPSEATTHNVFECLHPECEDRRREVLVTAFPFLADVGLSPKREKEIDDGRPY